MLDINNIICVRVIKVRAQWEDQDAARWQTETPDPRRAQSESQTAACEPGTSDDDEGAGV